MEELAKKKRAIDHVTIQEIHEIVSRGILEDAGRYRNRNVRIAGAVKAPPDWSKIVKLMDELIGKTAESKGILLKQLHFCITGLLRFILSAMETAGWPGSSRICI